jgi:mycothiol system anti-sigma-R factor
MKEHCSNESECMAMLQSILDGDTTPEQTDHFIKHHLEECIPCYKTYHLEMAIRTLLKKKCVGNGAPNDLVEKIKSQISQFPPH